jgi:hypothetical protein
MALAASMKPVRVRLSSMPVTLAPPSPAISAMASANAADDGSPATSALSAFSICPPRTDTIGPPAPRSSTPTSTPKARSIRSVWSRVASFSSTTVTPSARKPASMMADFTCAEASGGA